ncbi:GlcNAc-PI de-N-acetylase [Herbidospora galbida]|uniref:GlcNAc-PI de-N-acetylase n=1 Tax=Herbidospora galbida TaxID=2575442 RepID=A0A4U3MPL2_9ACTN|nr:PIG-L family deacetylase [Herbidospora galbida]TKK90217.1 GlcNAc-PI de-N-acetylase [Herbidospora galbida]
MFTLMAVHAHPDDEVMGTGGVFAHYAAQGVRTVLVTCTNGEQGDGPDGVKPGEPGHDDEAVAKVRLAELRESAAHLGISDVELLGYRDSGMDGWDGNRHERAFANVPVDEAAERVAELMRKYQPQVVLTYDENGGYGHPDHIQAHRVAARAVELSGVPAKFYYTATPRSWMKDMYDGMVAAGMETEGWDEYESWTTPDEEISAILDTSAYVEHKIKAISAHGSQGDSAFFLGLPPETQRLMFSGEAFTLVKSTVPAYDGVEDDLFRGLR